ncbi:hypothetical protein J1G42_07170 [Cellulomonas sp. zg-ZUI222]|uniref:Flp pilus-assembly TadG-like N-terminal domain-containing protein n=1 Tax=Cellulomonas wangleii TaxID=2816956 RepID=A0ABX8D2V9_9CELL|nr:MULTISPECIES: hypothetical protein [Cellulomonas]MBO0899742.1 hypothetical protein [Cellulomonas sp. zg-ZUI22]MBO0920604.1 hypothetical protein [Cellulomonas wangleii]MBO0922978.1 hypothetical protein [Cellulomonas wangleii]QVI61368.1 hypothetical protein KG103_12870 [Cellulomonas wangleii]
MRVAAVRARMSGDDRGVSTLEYMGVVALAAILVVATVLGTTNVGPYAAAALCRVTAALDGGAGGCDTTPETDPDDDMDYHPGVCMLSESKEKYSAEVKIWFFKLSDSSGFIVQEYSDGTVRATLTDGGGIGASGNLGSKTFDAGKLGDGDNAGAEVSLGGNLKFEYGSTWEFDSKKQWESMREQLDDYLIQQEQMKGEGAAGMAFYLWLTDGWVEAPKDPKISYSKISLEAALKASAGTRIPGTSKDDKGNDKLIDPKLGVNGSVTAGGSVIVMNDKQSGSKSYTYELSGKGTLGGSMIVGHATGEGSITGAFTTTYDKDGNLSQIAFKSAYEVGGTGSLGNNTFKAASGSLAEGETRSVVTTTKLDVTDANRALVQGWIDDHAAGTTLTLPFSAMMPEKPSDDPFMQLMYEQARLSRVTYHNVKDSWEFGAAVKKGWEFGFNISAEEATATKTEAQFLGAPGRDGARQLVDDALCN